MSQIINNKQVKRSLDNEWIVITDMKQIKTLFPDINVNSLLIL